MILVAISKNDTSAETALYALSVFLNINGRAQLSARYAHKDSGAPFFEGAEGINVSVSHSGEYVIACVSDGAVGVDIQKIVDSDHTAVAERFNMSLDKINFYREFCSAEAYSKATGENLFSVLKKAVQLKEHTAIYDFIPGYVLALCTGNSDTPIFCFKTC